MAMTKTIIFLLLPLIFSLPSHGVEILADWKHIATEKEIEVYRGEIKDSPLVAFKGKATIAAPLPKVLSVIYDVSKIKQWLSDVKEVEVLERQANFGKIEYNRTKAQWPVRDRDFVYQVTVKVMPDQKAVEINIQSTEHPGAPNPKGVVRGELRSGRYFLQALDQERTHLEVEIFADPKGSIPKWMVNLVQKSWPINTISGIRRLASDAGYQVHPDIQQAISVK
jgi:hypothetical protein